MDEECSIIYMKCSTCPRRFVEYDQDHADCEICEKFFCWNCMIDDAFVCLKCVLKYPTKYKEHVLCKSSEKQ